jgi:Electron transfer flavoprotein, alpha subunit
MSRTVLVLSEVRDGKLRNVSYECVAAARRIAEGGRWWPPSLARRPVRM